MNQVIRERAVAVGCQIQIVQGDITAETTDAIVNAANSHLMHGGGVAGVISRKGGPTIQEESNLWVQEHGPVSHDQPAHTSAGDLPCKTVIHAVGPVWGAGEEDRKLAEAVTGSLKTAEALGLRSIAIPAISTGIFGFPTARAAEVIFNAIQIFLRNEKETRLQQIRLVLYDQRTVDIFLKVYDSFPWYRI